VPILGTVAPEGGHRRCQDKDRRGPRQRSELTTKPFPRFDSTALPRPSPTGSPSLRTAAEPQNSSRKPNCNCRFGAAVPPMTPKFAV